MAPSLGAAADTSPDTSRPPVSAPTRSRLKLGRVSAGGVERDVTFELADPAVSDALTRALHAKYDRFGPGPVGAITGPDVLETTLYVRPRD